MKSAYELAMERLEKDKPSGPPLTDEQRQAIADINEKYEAKIAQARIMADQQKASAQGDYQAMQEIQANLQVELQKLEEERESKKQAVRDEKK
ncbi:MAG: hypothetical protein JXR73_23325 [Candidatus Omnitrophica bacterium]|nr:hypothetical protein [Candidatus Omnitrophota bacterium]